MLLSHMDIMMEIATSPLREKKYLGKNQFVKMANSSCGIKYKHYYRNVQSIFLLFLLPFCRSLYALNRGDYSQFNGYTIHDTRTNVIDYNGSAVEHYKADAKKTKKIVSLFSFYMLTIWQNLVDITTLCTQNLFRKSILVVYHPIVFIGPGWPFSTHFSTFFFLIQWKLPTAIIRCLFEF